MVKNMGNEILDAVERMINNSNKNASYNWIKYGTIIKILGNGKYTVVIEGMSQDMPSLNNQTFSISDNVIIVIPNNNISKQFILGKIRY